MTIDLLGFVWDVNEFIWENNIAKLKEFKAKHGHANVPRRYAIKSLQILVDIVE